MEENDNNCEIVSKDDSLIQPKDITTEEGNNVAKAIPIFETTPIVKDEVASKKNGGKKRRNNRRNMAGDLGKIVRLKRRKIKVAGAPKMPLNGYVRYMNDRREKLRREYPNKSVCKNCPPFVFAIEHTKIIGEEWHQLTLEEKTPYMEAAEIDRQRYNTELQEFLKTHPDVWENEIAKSKARKNASIELNKSKQTESTLLDQNLNIKGDEDKVLENEAGTSNPTQLPNVLVEKSVSPITTTFSGNYSESIMNSSNNNNNNNCTNPFVKGEIPIFTNEFLDHNKVLDNELRVLRKSKIDLEQQNAVLEKHVDNLKSGVQLLSVENTECHKKIHMLDKYYENLKQRLVKGLASEQLSTDQPVVTLENIENYMANLSNSNFRAHDIIQKLDLQIPIEK